MFGTGIPGFAIITSLIGAITYIVTFGLLKQRNLLGIIKGSWRKDITSIAEKQETKLKDGQKTSEANVSMPFQPPQQDPSYNVIVEDGEILQEPRRRVGRRHKLASLFGRNRITLDSEHEL